MKKYILIAFLSFFTVDSYAQDIKWEKDYPKALRLAEQSNALLLVYFTDGSQPSIEKNIELNILKSKNFKNTIKKSIIVLHIDESSDSRNKDYNRRVLSAYNPYKKFPSVRVILPKSRKATSLLTKFDDKDVENFISELNSLKK